MKNIITIQHTQSEQHVNGMIGSSQDWDLTPLGVEQAKRIGQRLSSQIKDMSYTMYCSDLLRAKHTADIVVGYLGIQPIYTDTLREFDLGVAVGKTKEWARLHSCCPVWPSTVDWAETVDGKPFLGAESKRDVWDRLMVFYQEMMANTEENLIIVSHAGTLSLFYAMWLGLDLSLLNKCNFSGVSGGVSFLQEDSAGHRMISRLNDLSFIQ